MSLRVYQHALSQAVGATSLPSDATMRFLFTAITQDRKLPQLRTQWLCSQCKHPGVHATVCICTWLSARLALLFRTPWQPHGNRYSQHKLINAPWPCDLSGRASKDNNAMVIRSCKQLRRGLPHAPHHTLLGWHVQRTGAYGL